jgi:uncharacterized membrane protein HdeD (DUF308 family)
MTPPEVATEAAPDLLNRRLPPITQLCVAGLGLIVAGGIYLAAKIPSPVSLAPAVGLLCAAAVLVMIAGALLSRVRPFAWRTFARVYLWALLAYLVVAGMIAYVFIIDRTPGRVLAVLIAMLVVYAVDIPLLLAYTVARYQET